MKTPEELKVFHDQRQAGCTVDELCIREGIVVKPHIDSFFPFEFFSYRSPEMTLEMDCFIKYARGRKSFLDIGAFHGLFALVFSELNKDGKSYAFEPSPKVYQILKHNASNHENVYAFNRALSDGYGVVAMHEEWDHYVIGEPTEGDGAIVKCFSGDTFCEDYNLIDTIKIDVEGMELEVLKGLEKTIEKYHPVIFLELHNERIINKGGSIEDITDLLVFWGYKAIDSRTNQPISFQEIEEVKTGELRLILL